MLNNVHRYFLYASFVVVAFLWYDTVLTFFETLAVAGFSVDELAVTVEGGQLIVRGKQTDDTARDYLYRGIAARRFKRSFGLADGVEVRKAELHDGLLAIELERSVKDATIKTVRIADGETAKPRRATVYDAE